jgi:hypothetical protein
MSEADERIQLTIRPQPTDEELVAILHALELLEKDRAENEASDNCSSSNWYSIGRDEQQRTRHWPFQEQSWQNRR